MIQDISEGVEVNLVVDVDWEFEKDVEGAGVHDPRMMQERRRR
jgi:hypothetical protein